MVTIFTFDTASPEVIDKSDDILYQHGITGHSIFWEFHDTNPSHYRLYRNNVLILEYPWINQTYNLTINVDSLELGYYNYTLLIWWGYLRLQVSLLWFMKV
jgi:hypothetical protein